MTLKFTILGCGSSGGVPRPALGWGACDPTNPKNRRRRTSLLVERHDNGGVTRVLVDTPPDLREQLLDANVDRLDGVLYTHEHADHIHGIDDLRAFFIKQRQLIDVYLDEHTATVARTRFGYCFETPPGSEYPPIVREHRLAAGQPVTIEGPGGPITALPILQEHGDIASLGFRFGIVCLFLRSERPAARQRRGSGGPRCLDRRRASLPAASEPFLARRRAWLDRAAEAAPRDPDEPACRSRLRNGAQGSSDERRACFRWA